MMGEFNAKDANFLWRQIGRIDGVIETLNRTGGVLLCSITDSGFTSIAGVISAVKDKLPGKDHKKMIFEIRNDGRNEYGRYNNCGGKI